MRWKTLIIITLLLAGAAIAAPRTTLDQQGNLYKYWIDTSAGTSDVLKLSKSIDQGITYSRPVDLYPFTREADSLELTFNRGLVMLVYSISQEVYLTTSKNNGVVFSSPILLSRHGSQPTGRLTNDNLITAWEEKNGTMEGIGINQIAGLPGQASYFINITDEALSSPAVVIDQINAAYLLFVSTNNKFGDQRIYFSGTVTAEPRLLEKSYNKLSEPKLFASPWGLLALWRENDNGKVLYKVSASIDQGKHFSFPREIEQPANIDQMEFSGNKWFARTFLPEPAIQPLEFAPPATPKPLAPTADSMIDRGTVEVTYQLETADPVLTSIEIAGDESFSADQTWLFQQLVMPDSTETRYHLPVALPDGKYWLRLSAFNGLSPGLASAPSPFLIDTTAPKISISSPSAEAVEQSETLLIGRISEPAKLELNGQPLSAEASGSFKALLSLRPGKNILNFTATDEAGNTSFLAKVLDYSSIRPEIRVIKPGEGDWFKPGATVYFACAVNDLQDDIDDESEGDIIISGINIEDKLAYDKKARTLSGFIDLPADLPDGKLAVEIRLKDSAGNLGKKLAAVNLDHTPPAIDIGNNQLLFTNSLYQITVPAVDSGAGIDSAASLLLCSGVSFESQNATEADQIVARSKFPLTEGTHEIEVVPRDRIGNTGNSCHIMAVVDSIPPRLAILSSCETQTANNHFTVQGEAEDVNLSEVKILNNHKEVDSFSPAANFFSREIRLFPGKNEIVVEALDKAGNRSIRPLSIFSTVQSAGTLITSYANGPNPFSPQSNGQMFFTFDLPAAADLRFFVFDLGGTLLWTRELKNQAGTGNLAWDGTDNFGNRLESGLYPYLLQVNAGGEIEIKRGKIIVLQ